MTMTFGAVTQLQNALMSLSMGLVPPTAINRAFCIGVVCPIGRAAAAHDTALLKVFQRYDYSQH